MDSEQSPPEEDLPRFVKCEKCRREYTLKECKPKTGVGLETIAFHCPRCSRPLREIRYRLWYQKQIQGALPPELEKDPKTY